MLTRGKWSRCAVCHLPVKGLTWYCGTCGHGGHQHCMLKWMGALEKRLSSGVSGACVGGHCPAACGCECLSDQTCQPVDDGNGAAEPTPEAVPGGTPREQPRALFSASDASAASARDGAAGGACFGPQSSSAVLKSDLDGQVTFASDRDQRPLPVPLALSEAAEAYRKAYGQFRKGFARGAKGEVTPEALAASTASKHTHRRTASGGNSPIIQRQQRPSRESLTADREG